MSTLQSVYALDSPPATYATKSQIAPAWNLITKHMLLKQSQFLLVLTVAGGGGGCQWFNAKFSLVNAQSPLLSNFLAVI